MTWSRRLSPCADVEATMELLHATAFVSGNAGDPASRRDRT